jgi:hypothetical protein
VMMKGEKARNMMAQNSANADEQAA